MALTRPKYSQIYDSDYKNSARVATTDSVTLVGGAPTVVDNITLVAGDRVVVRAQANTAQNGIYRVNTLGTGSNGTWGRTLDADTAAKLTPGTTLSIEEGTTYGGKQFRMTTPAPITLGVTGIAWTDISGGGGAATGGTNGQVQFNDLNSLGGATYLYYNNATGQVTANAGIASTSTASGTFVVTGGLGISGALNVGANVTVTGNVLPSANVTYNLGSPTQRWKDLFLSGTTINLNGATISATNGAITFQNSLGGSFSVTGSAGGQSTGTFGNLIANSGVASTSTSTGALTVTGGAGITGAVYVGGALSVSGDTTVTGNLTVNGTTTNINTTNLVIEDKNMVLADVTTPTNTTADGAGITIKGATDKTFNWVNATAAWTSSEDLNLLTGKQYEIAGTSVLTATTLGSGVVNSSLTSLGTVTSLVATTAVASNFSSANMVSTGSTSGTWSTANIALYESVTAFTTNQTFYPTFSNIATTGNTITGVATNLSFNASTGNLTATGHVGNFWGPVAATTANVSSTLAVTGTSAFTGATNHAGGITASTVSAGTIGNSGATLNGSGSGITSLGTTTDYQVGSLSIGTRMGSAGLSVNGTTGDNDSQLILKKPSQSSWSVLTWNDVVYQGFNIYYDNGAWVHNAPTGSNVNSLLATTTSGMNWYASNNGTSSWNQASNQSLWDLTGAWIGKINTTQAQTIAPSANLTYNLGSTTAWWNNVYGVSVQAKYADLAEHYESDVEYPAGTVVVFGGDKEITVTTQDHDPRVAGIVSTNPAYLMNAANPGIPVALQGRVPCRVQGPVTKGDVLVTSTTAGVAQKIDNAKFLPGCVVGKALETINTNNIQTIEVVVGRF